MPTGRNKTHADNSPNKGLPQDVDRSALAEAKAELTKEGEAHTKAQPTITHTQAVETEAAPEDATVESTSAKRVKEIKSLNAAILKQVKSEEDAQDKLSEAQHAFAKMQKSHCGLYWRLGKLLEAEKPLHTKGWMVFCDSIGLGKDRVSRAGKAIKKYKSQDEAEKHSVRSLDGKPKKKTAVDDKLLSFAKWIENADMPTNAKQKADVMDALDALDEAIDTLRKQISAVGIAPKRQSKKDDGLLAGVVK